MDRETGLGRIRWALFALFEVLALPWRSGDGLGIVVATAAALLATGAVEWTFRRHMLLSLTLLVAFTLVYIVGLGDVVGEGVVRLSVYATPSSALESLGLLVACFAGIGLLARATQRWAAARLPARPPAAHEAAPAWQGGVWIFCAIVIVSAWTTSRWSNWTGTDPTLAAAESDGLGLPHLYSGVLFLVVGLAAYARLDGRRFELGVGLRSAAQALAPLVIGLCIFLLQSRRLMIVATVLLAAAGLATIDWGRRQLRVKVGIAFLTLVSVLMLVASSRWRDVDADLGNTGLMDRMERVLTGTEGTDVRESIEARLTYLWFDAIARDLEVDTYDSIDIGMLAASEVARAVPRAFLPGKDDVPIITCETPFVELGFFEDLPCTPHTEAWIAGGYPALLLMVVLWGLFIGGCEALVGRGPGYARIAGLFVFFPFTSLEGGMFPMIQGVRQAVIGLALIAILSLGFRFLRAPRGRVTERPAAG